MKPTKLLMAEQSVVVYHHVPQESVSLKDMQKPEYWTHVTLQLRAGYRIEVFAPDGTWWAMLIVRAVGARDAVVGVLNHVKLGEEVDSIPADSPLEVKWKGPHKKFAVLRKADGEILRDELQTKEAAHQWAGNHLRSLAA